MRDTSKKRESILDAAEQAFMNEGYETTSMDRIAELAGASKRTVYNHFPSKEELFRAVLDRMMSAIIALEQIAYDPRADLATQLGAFADVKIRFSSNPNWIGMMKVITGVFISNPELIKEVMVRAEEKEDTLVIWLNAACADGRLDVPDPKLAAKAFWAMVGGAFFWPSIFEGPIEASQATPMKTELVEMFLARYRTR